MNKETETVIQKRKGTKKRYEQAVRKRRVKSFLGQKLGTQTHASEKDYHRSREKEKLRDMQKDL